MVELRRIVESRGFHGRLLAKLEYLNPGFSKKDRIALEMIRVARDTGSLSGGQTVVELTSGNTGTGLAIVCRALGHPFITVMSTGNTIERARMMQALGAEVVLVEQAAESLPGQVSGQDLELVDQRTRELVQERGAFRADQFSLQAAVSAHERFTGPEMWIQAKGRIDVFLDFVGTASTFTGVMKYLRSRNPDIRGYVVEPASAQALAGARTANRSHKIQGGGYDKTAAELPLFDPGLASGYVTVTDQQAIEGARTLASEEGIFGGFSSGAHCAASIELIAERERGATIAFLVCDSGLKYMSTELYPLCETMPSRGRLNDAEAHAEAC
nr:cysteine synthase family protein [Pirellulales bacterium]